jgi:hypothetical protein
MPGPGPLPRPPNVVVGFLIAGVPPANLVVPPWLVHAVA